MAKTNPKKRPAPADFLEDANEEEVSPSPRHCLGKKKKRLPKKRIILEDRSCDGDREKEKSSCDGAPTHDQLPHNVVTKKLLAFLKTQDLCALANIKTTTLKRNCEDRKKLNSCQVCFETRIFPNNQSQF